MRDKNLHDSYFPRRPRRFSRSSRKAHTSLRYRSRKSLSAELKAGGVARHTLSRFVRADWFTYTRTAQGFTMSLYSGQNLFLSGTPTKFDLLSRLFFSPSLLRLRSCANRRDCCCFSAYRRAPSRRDNFFEVIFFAEGLRSKRVKLSCNGRGLSQLFHFSASQQLGDPNPAPLTDPLSYICD